MATVGYMGPFHGKALGPGEAQWINFGESDGYAHSALSVTAVAVHGQGGKEHVLKVDNVNVTATNASAGDIEMYRYNAGCNVTNNGKTTITDWVVWVGVISP